MLLIASMLFCVHTMATDTHTPELDGKVDSLCSLFDCFHVFYYKYLVILLKDKFML